MYVAFIPVVPLVPCQGTVIIGDNFYLWPRVRRAKSLFNLTKLGLSILEALVDRANFCIMRGAHYNKSFEQTAFSFENQ